MRPRDAFLDAQILATIDASILPVFTRATDYPEGYVVDSSTCRARRCCTA